MKIASYGSKHCQMETKVQDLEGLQGVSLASIVFNSWYTSSKSRVSLKLGKSEMVTKTQNAIHLFTQKYVDVESCWGHEPDCLKENRMKFPQCPDSAGRW